ncbi:MAG: endopeptidase La [Deltaproteobacteria bacterium]|nr:endopeptidase La [Deltaproteobacteria bacterium]
MNPENELNEEKAIAVVDPSSLPDEIPILPLEAQVAFPGLNMTLAVKKDSFAALEKVTERELVIGVLGVKPKPDQLPVVERVYTTGTAVRVLYVTRVSEDDIILVAHGLKRFRVQRWLSESPFIKAAVDYAPEIVEPDVETDALYRSLRDLSAEVFSMSMEAPKEAVAGLAQIKNPLNVAYIAATHANIDFEKRQEILEEDNLKVKMRELVTALSREKEILSLGRKIKDEARIEMSKTQREYYLRQQLKAIKEELGESPEDQSESEDYRQRIDSTDMSDEARKEALRELDRFEEMTPQSAEYAMVKTYLDWLVDLPWNRTSEDQTDIEMARRTLDEDHYGLQEVKDRIVEYLAVRNLLKIRKPLKTAEAASPTSAAMGVILCFAGPPGVGKTSLGQSIARSMGREFTRMSLGGMRDEAEIRGHRRTYIGAMPGRIIQAIKRAGTRNPVFMLDEVDKIGMDWRGDPSSALLEVLDPAQNAAFRDHYLGVDFDLSDVVFIATANQLDTIPAPLRDRMEIIQLDGYTELEKTQIARRHLIPRQLENHGLNDNEITFMDKAIRKVIGNYTREAGVRQLERLIGTICRKCVVNLTTNGWSHVLITPGQVEDYLKKERFETEHSEEIDVPGVATGLAVTATGGDILFIEATRMNGRGNLRLTGQLGDVMKESAQIAHSYIRSQSELLGIDPGQFEATEVHLHVPAGAIPKDGPSAGIAMAMSLASLFTGRKVHSDVGMTGEITLRGRVLPVGGIKMKVLAAHRAGLRTVILPKRNARDLDDVPEEIRDAMQFVMVDRIDEAIQTGLTSVDAHPGGISHQVDQTLKHFDEEVLA